jgi:hypothetical protein
MTNQYLHNALLEHKHIVDKAMEEDLYRYQRYGVPFSITAFYSDSRHLSEMMGEYIRLTDTVVKLDDHLVCVIYGNVGYQDAFKASENMLYDLNNAYPDVKISAGMTSVTKVDLPKDLLKRALQNLGSVSDKPESYVGDDTVIDYMLEKAFFTVK